MTQVLAIAGNTLRELIRNKLLYLLLVFAVLMIFGSLVLAQLTIGQWERIINDVGLATVQLSGALVAILVGVGLIAGEIDRRTVYVTLAKPVSRGAFVLGRYLGLCATLALLVLVMGGALAALLSFIGDPMGATGYSALLLTYVELCILSAFAVVFSSFTTQTLGVMFTLAVFVIGHLTQDLTAFAQRIEGLGGQALGALSYVLPNLDLLNLKTHAANNLPVSPMVVVKGTIYGLCYSCVAVMAAMGIFSRRDFK